MDVNARRTSNFGRVTVRRLGSGRRPSADKRKRPNGHCRSRYTWRPSRLLKGQVVTTVPLAFECERLGSKGPRRFAPYGGPSAWILLASVGGHAILRQLHPATGEQHYAYDAMRLLYQLAPRLQEHLDREFRRIEDLFIPRPARIADEIDILPDSVGLAADGTGHRWSVHQFAEAGRSAAADAGVVAPSHEQIIRYGLIAAARRQPIDVTELDQDQAASLVRLAVFDFGPSTESLKDGIKDEIIGRLLDAVNKHLDDPIEKFHEWLFEKVDNLVHQIAKRKRPGGEIHRSIVRQIILETVFKSFRYMGDCIDLQAKAFADACKPKLNADERAAFAAIYEKQPYLGDLPLLLLHRQLAFAQEAAIDVINNPGDAQRAGIFLRVLQFYAEMVRKKRECERRYKQQAGHRNDRNASALKVGLDKAGQIATACRTPLFQEIAAVLREQRNAKCPCGNTVEWFAEIGNARGRRKKIEIIDNCEGCGHREVFQTTTEEIKAAAALI